MRGKLSSVPTQTRQQELTTAINYTANQNEAGPRVRPYLQTAERD